MGDRGKQGGRREEEGGRGGWGTDGNREGGERREELDVDGGTEGISERGGERWRWMGDGGE